MNAIKLLAILLAMFFLVGCSSPSKSEKNSKPKPDSQPEPETRPASVSDNMTKWGPKLSREELAEIAKLSTSELADMLRTGDTMHKFAALSILRGDGMQPKNFDLLLSLAAEGVFPLIAEGLIRPIKVSASAEDKRQVDKFLDFLESQLEKKASAYHYQAIRCIGQTIFMDPTLSYGMHRNATKTESPYGTERAIEIFIRCLNSENSSLRGDAYGQLRSICRFNLSNAKDVVAALKVQRTKIEAGQKTPELKAQIEEEMGNSIEALDRYINQDRKKNAMPGFRGPGLPLLLHVKEPEM